MKDEQVETHTTDDLAAEEALVARLQARDPAAAREIYARYGARIRRVARRFASAEWDVEEIVQDVVWTVYRRASSFQGNTRLWNWIFRITQNAARMHLRSARRHPVPIEDAAVEAILHDEPSIEPTPRPDHVIEHERAVERMNLQLGLVHPLNRELFRQIDLDGRSIQEAAASRGMSVSAVKARLHRVRSVLREAVAG